LVRVTGTFARSVALLIEIGAAPRAPSVFIWIVPPVIVTEPTVLAPWMWIVPAL
jgi:hypothetical protein